MGLEEGEDRREEDRSEEEEQAQREVYAELDRRAEEERALKEKYAEEPVTKKQSIGMLAAGIILTILGAISEAALFIYWRPSGGLFTGVAALLLVVGLFLLVAWWREGRRAF